jgi:hypothetical protein
MSANKGKCLSVREKVEIISELERNAKTFRCVKNSTYHRHVFYIVILRCAPPFFFSLFSDKIQEGQSADL